MKTTITCPSCNHEQTIDVTFKVNFFGCVSCLRYFDNTGAKAVVKETFKPFYFERSLSVGAAGTFDNESYTVTGLVIKSLQSLESWCEYLLQTQRGKPLYISESQGHFIKMEALDATFDMTSFEKNQIFEEIRYTRIAVAKPKVRLAVGFFEEDVLQPAKVTEFIAPPLIISREVYDETHTIWYKGAHLPRPTVKKAFELSKLAGRYGTGLVQPFYFEPFRVAQILLAMCLLVIGITMLRNYDRETTIVYDAFVPLNGASASDLVSNSFEVTGSRAPLTVHLASEVDNSWASTTIGLVNEETNEEIYATRDLEFYQGYEAGEHWTEGSKSDEFNFCGVPAGKYHFIINVSKSEIDTTTTGVHIRAESGMPVYHNMWIVLVVCVVLIIAAYIAKDKFEENRY